MNELDKGSSAPAPEGSAKGDPKDDQSPPARVIKEEDHQRALDDMKKAKAKAKELEQRLAEKETQELQKQGEWKTLAEREKELRLVAEEKAERLNTALYHDKKFGEVYREAVKAGLKPSALQFLEMLPLDGVEVEMTSQGRMLVHGAESFVADLKRKHGDVLFSQPKAPNVNSGGSAAENNSSEVTPQMIFAAEKKKDMAEAKRLTELYLKQKGRR